MMNEKKACAISHKEDNQEINLNALRRWMKIWIDGTDDLTLLKAVYTVMRNCRKGGN